MGSLAVKSGLRFFRYSVVSTGPTTLADRPHNPFEIVQRLHDETETGDAVVVEVQGYLNSMAITHIITMWRQVITKGATFRCILADSRSWDVVGRAGLCHSIDFRICTQPQGCLVGCGAGKACHCGLVE